MGLVHGDEKAAGAMRALHRGEEDHFSRPTVDSLFLAVGTLQVMLIKFESNKVRSGELGLRHSFPVERRRSTMASYSRSGYFGAKKLSVR